MPPPQAATSPPPPDPDPPEVNWEAVRRGCPCGTCEAARRGEMGPEPRAGEAPPGEGPPRRRAADAILPPDERPGAAPPAEPPALPPSDPDPRPGPEPAASREDEDRLAALEARLERRFDERLRRMEETLARRVERRLAHLEGLVVDAAWEAAWARPSEAPPVDDGRTASGRRPDPAPGDAPDPREDAPAPEGARRPDLPDPLDVASQVVGRLVSGVDAFFDELRGPSRRSPE